MRIGCRKSKCLFWKDDKNYRSQGFCIDEENYINKENGQKCCRYHPNAIYICEPAHPENNTKEC